MRAVVVDDHPFAAGLEHLAHVAHAHLERHVVEGLRADHDVEGLAVLLHVDRFEPAHDHRDARLRLADVLRVPRVRRETGRLGAGGLEHRQQPSGAATQVEHALARHNARHKQPRIRFGRLPQRLEADRLGIGDRVEISRVQEIVAEDLRVEVEFRVDAAVDPGLLHFAYVGKERRNVEEALDDRPGEAHLAAMLIQAGCRPRA